jgi:hypothetical protein
MGVANLERRLMIGACAERLPRPLFTFFGFLGFSFVFSRDVTHYIKRK